MIDTLFGLFTLGASFIARNEQIPAADVLATAIAVIEVVDEPLLFPGERRFWMRQGYGEGRFAESPKGDNDKHLGGACGEFQVNTHMIPAGFGTCAELRADRSLSLAAARVLLRDAIKRCGSVRGGIGALFTTGKCGGAPLKVAARCSGAC